MNRRVWMIFAFALLLVAATVLVVGRAGLVFTQGASSPLAQKPLAEKSVERSKRPPTPASMVSEKKKSALHEHDQSDVVRRETVVPDDGQTLWASPTAGEPIVLRYLPPGAQVILVLRLADLQAHQDWEKLFAAIGPAGSRYLAWVERVTGISPSKMEQLIVGVCGDREDPFVTVGVIHMRAQQSITSGARRWAGWTPIQHDGETYYQSVEKGGQAPSSVLGSIQLAERRDFRDSSGASPRFSAVYLPAEAQGSTVVFGPAAAIEEVIRAAGAAPPLRREMEALLADSDAARHVTILLAPSFLQSDGKALLSGVAAKLSEPLDWFFGDRAQAVLLSVHIGESFFAELRVAGTSDVAPAKLSTELRDRLHEVPERVEAYVVSLRERPYGRLLLHRFPQMVRLVDRFTRCAVEHRQAVLRCYLPAAAGHNLLFGVELTLAEHRMAERAPTARKATSPQTVRERLWQPMTLRFEQDTLESALRMVAEAVGVEIVIAGRDLQLDGITKNQSFGINVADQPAEEVLLRILRLANPDKSAQSAADPAQKLVYVMRSNGRDGSEQVVVTTRSQAEKRGELLPEAFVVGRNKR